MEQSQPLINILIRTSSRPAQFARCLESIRNQTYKNIQIIVGFDNPEAVRYIPIGDNIRKLFIEPFCNYPYFYDLYCNTLKLLVTHGWFFFLDDDDALASNTVLEELAEHLTEPADNYIRKKIIAEGKIGLPCLVLHSKHKALSGLYGHKAGDYRYIKEVTDQVPTKFIALPLVNAGARGHGKMEGKDNLSNISE
jgi:glycosyltransferase involved in cell wall biosynthesis